MIVFRRVYGEAFFVKRPSPDPFPKTLMIVHHCRQLRQLCGVRNSEVFLRLGRFETTCHWRPCVPVNEGVLDTACPTTALVRRPPI